MAAVSIGVSSAKPLKYLGGAVNCARWFHEWAQALGYESRLLVDDPDPVTLARLSGELQSMLSGAASNRPLYALITPDSFALAYRRDGIEQSRALAAALRAGGTAVQINDFPGTGLKGHMEINRSLGDPAYPATSVVDDWLKARFAS